MPLYDPSTSPTTVLATSVSDSDTTHAPDGNSVFDALALKANDADVVHDTGNETIAGVKTFSSDPLIPDEAYGAGWNGSLEPPTKNAVYDKVETLGGITNSAGNNVVPTSDGANLEASRITDDGTNTTVPTLQLGTAPFASDGLLRLGAFASIKGRNAANTADIRLVERGGSDILRFGAGDVDAIGEGAVFQITPSPPDGDRIDVQAGGSDAGAGGIAKVAGGNGSTVGGDVQLQGGGGATFGGGVFVDAGAATDDSTAGGIVEIHTGVGKGVPVGTITFHTAGTEAVADAVQTLNTRGTMSDTLFTWDGVLKLTPRAFAALPASPEEGMMAWVNDSSTATWGATIAGGGANKVLAVFNGTVWTVAGK